MVRLKNSTSSASVVVWSKTAEVSTLGSKRNRVSKGDEGWGKVLSYLLEMRSGPGDGIVLLKKKKSNLPFKLEYRPIVLRSHDL